MKFLWGITLWREEEKKSTRRRLFLAEDGIEAQEESGEAAS